MFHVTRCAHVLQPIKGTETYNKVARALIDSVGQSDADVILADESGGALAIWLAYQADVGNFTELVQVCNTVAQEVSEFYCTNGPRELFGVDESGQIEHRGYEEPGESSG